MFEMNEQRDSSRTRIRFSLATILAVIAIAAGLLTTLMNVGVIPNSRPDSMASSVKQWEQIDANSLREAMRIWQQINSGATMSTLAKNNSLNYVLVDGQNPSKTRKNVRDKIQETNTGELGPIVQMGNKFCVTRVVKRNDQR